MEAITRIRKYNHDCSVCVPKPMREAFDHCTYAIVKQVGNSLIFTPIAEGIGNSGSMKMPHAEAVECHNGEE